MYLLFHSNLDNHIKLASVHLRRSRREMEASDVINLEDADVARNEEEVSLKLSVIPKEEVVQVKG